MNPTYKIKQPIAVSLAALSFTALLLVSMQLQAQDFIPRKQNQPPGPPLSPTEALAKMQVPEGFHVELVASEPDLMNPVAMAFDDAGRIYVTESFEYPRHEPGPGRDRIKILHDTDGDGKIDSVKIFADGLNIPSGIAVGHGGVWVANAPDILFLEDTDGDDVADRQSVVVTGFGRIDTHELPNALTWGPDGYLYGLNGVFNPSVVEQNGKRFEFTCAMFRIDPRTKRFELFCEGTSNPWGIAFDAVGSAFISACVIDHLWHLTQSAYYLRQGGPYPPHTWWAESIVKHKHQMAAYCGIEYFDSDAYPASYRDRLYMGNIHGGCINSDRIERFGATYQGFGEPDFLTANDVWFMPVAQKVGPDGCLYVLDWYDRYHCYQDASADPKGVDRGHGRLYRIVHGERPTPRFQDLSKLTNTELIAALSDPNIFVRQRSQLKLAERAQTLTSQEISALEVIGLKGPTLKSQLHAIWALAGAHKLREEFVSWLLDVEEPEIRAWGIRLTAEQFPTNTALRQRCEQLAKDSDARVRLQAAIAAPKFASSEFDASDVMNMELDVLNHSQDDPIIGRVVWQNSLPIAQTTRQQVLKRLTDRIEQPDDLLRSMLPRFAGKWIDDAIANRSSQKEVQDLLSELLNAANKLKKVSPDNAAAALRPIFARLQSKELTLPTIEPVLKKFRAENPSPDWGQWNSEKLTANEKEWNKSELILGLIVGEEQPQKIAEGLVLDRTTAILLRQELLNYVSIRDRKLATKALLFAIDQSVEANQPKKPDERQEPDRQQIDKKWLNFAIELGGVELTDVDLEQLGSKVSMLAPGEQAALAEKMSQREPAASGLLAWIRDGKLRKELLSPNRIRLLAANGSDQAKSTISKIYGTVRLDDDPERERVVKRISEQAKGMRGGDAARGWLVYDRICGQCHIMHNRGVEVGPNITANGRGNFEQLLVSIFNPSLVIGDAYRSVTIRTDDDTVLTGLLVSRDATKTVVRTQGGKEVTVLAQNIESFQQDKKSLMPEGIESQLSDAELADLLALLSLEKPPGSPDNSTILATPGGLHGK